MGHLTIKVGKCSSRLTGTPVNLAPSLAMETDDVHILLLDWCSLGHCVMKPSKIFSANIVHKKQVDATHP